MANQPSFTGTNNRYRKGAQSHDGGRAMATNVQEMNTLELYFFCDPALKVAREYATALGPVVSATESAEWLGRSERAATELRAAVENQIKEEGEVSVALGASATVMARIGPWRQLMQSTAYISKDPNDRKELLRLAGFGLGHVRSVKEAKAFLAKVTPLVDARREFLLKRGLVPTVVDFPAMAKRSLESHADVVAKEKAEANLAQDRSRRARTDVAALLDAMDDAVEVVFQQAAFVEEAASKDTADKLLAHWTASMNEARVLTRKRVEKGDVPPSLVEGGGAAPQAGDASADPDEVG